MAKGLVGELLSAEQIRSRVAELGAEITDRYQGKELLVVGVLKGAFIFCSDLLRAIDLPAEVDFMAVSSYGQSTESSGVIKILKDLDTSVEGRHVLLVEDIVDTGLTLRYLQQYLLNKQPASLELVSLLDKPSRRRTDVTLNYSGFTIPDHFVVGYGIDYAEQYRNLPYIGLIGEL